MVPGYVFPEFNQIRILEPAVDEGTCHRENFRPAAAVQVVRLHLGAFWGATGREIGMGAGVMCRLGMGEPS